LFVGDSNITLSAGPIVWGTTVLNHFNDAYIPVFASKIGATIRYPDCVKSACTTHNYWQIKLRDTLQKVTPDAIVNNLGINDAGSPGTGTSQGYRYYGLKIDWFMSLIPRATPVFWTNLPCMIEPVGVWDGCKVVNKALATARDRWPNLVVVNWAARARAHPEYQIGGNRSNVHFSTAGAAAWIELVTSALDARMAAPG
jgi:lysophospholipase L1-like esterase